MAVTHTTEQTTWAGPDVADTAQWTVQLDAERANRLLAISSGVALGSATTLSQSDPLHGPWVDELLGHIDRIGLALLEGIPVDVLGADCAVAFWRLSSLLGEPILQNVAGQRIDVVRNEGMATVRGAKTDRELIFHSDFANTEPDVFGLLTVRQAKEGGDSLLVSGHRVHRELLVRHPDVVETLSADFLFDRTGDVGPDQAQFISSPVFRWEADGLRLLYNRARIHRGHRVAGVPLGPEQIRALDVLDETLGDPRLALSLRMQPGQAIFMDNRLVLHSRTAFTDWEDPGLRRELLRVWLSDRRGR